MDNPIYLSDNFRAELITNHRTTTSGQLQSSKGLGKSAWHYTSYRVAVPHADRLSLEITHRPDNTSYAA
ncbi:MAG: hypothetical protein IPI29_03250 [Ignavibacteria bacterium]|nr:hypothetical protein [Ignavibacteria bacterium]